MANHKDKKGQPVEMTPEDAYWKEIMRWLDKTHVAPKGWAALFQELQALITSLIEEKKIVWRIACLERAVTAMLNQTAGLAGAPSEIDFQLRAGQAYENFGAWDKALAAYRRAVELCASHRFVPQKIEALRWIGGIFTRQNQWRQAEEAFQESLKLCAQAGDETGQAHAENWLGILCFEQGELEQATAHWQAALELAEKTQARNLVAVIDNNLGALANVLGQREKALAYYGESLPLFETTGDTASLASAYHNIAMSHADQGHWPEASIHYEKSYRLAHQLGNVPLQTLVKLNRVELYLAIGDLALAEELCRQALQTYQRLQDHLGEADACKFLGVIAAKKRAWKKAQTHFEASIHLAQAFRHPLGEAEAHWEYGRMLKQKGANKLAREQFQQALALFRRLHARVEIEKVRQEIAALSK